MRTSCVLLALSALVCMMAQASAFVTSPFGLGASCAVNRLSAASPARRVAAPVDLKMVDITVAVNDGEPIESALRRFKNAVSKSGHLIELRRRKRFESNKEKEIRRDKEAARKRRMAKVRSQPMIQNVNANKDA